MMTSEHVAQTPLVEQPRVVNAEKKRKADELVQDELVPDPASIPLLPPTVHLVDSSTAHQDKKLKPDPLPASPSFVAPLGAGLDVPASSSSAPVASKDGVDPAKAKSKSKSKTDAEAKAEAKAKADAEKDFGKGQDEFYRRMIALTDASRGTGPDAAEAAKEVERIASRWETDSHYKEEMIKRVRVDPKKRDGSVAGYGLHELIPTSETPYVLRWSGGLLDGRDGKPAKKTNTFQVQLGDGQATEMSLIAAQQWYRTETARAIWKTGAGHSGALRQTENAKTSWFTEPGQKASHDVLREVLYNTLSAENVVPNLAYAHVQTTANEKDMDDNLVKGWDVKGRNAGDPGDKAKMKDTFLAQRDFNKQVAEVLHEKIPKGRDASPRRRETERPLSPLRDVSLYPANSAEARAREEGAARRNFGPADTYRLMLREAARRPRQARAQARSVSPPRSSTAP